MKDYFKLLRFLKAHKKLFVTSVGVMLIAGFFEVFSFSLLVPLVDIIFTKKQIVVPSALPHFLQGFVDSINQVAPDKLMPMILVGFLVMLLLKNFFVFLYQYFMSDLSQRVMRDIRFQLYERIQTLSLDYFSIKRTGELVSRITHDANLVENAVSYGLTDLFRQTFALVFWVGTALTIDPFAAVIIFGVFPMIGVPMAQIGKRLRKISKGIQEKMADINTLLLETISGVKLVKAFCTEQYEINRFREQNFSYYKLRIKSIKRIILISPITEVIGGIFGIAIILWFSKRLLAEELSFGIFTLFFASIMQIISPIKKLGNVHALIQQALSANDRIYEVLESKPTVVEKKDPVHLSEFKSSIKLSNVSFSYDLESGIVLRHIDLEVNRGELVAIVGPTGSGKTTLANLIPRFYDPTEGKVTMDGIDLRDADFLSFRRQIGIVTQESILFNDTVKANITYGFKEASQKEVEEAAAKAFAHPFIQKLPQGYDTIIGDRGFRLSGGEKQRLCIARAILRNPPILILDEATSQLDSESERFVQEALDKLMEGRTVVVIAHRLSTIKKADKIVVLENGRIVGEDKHEDLIKNCGLYSKLHTMQFQL